MTRSILFALGRFLVSVGDLCLNVTARPGWWLIKHNASEREALSYLQQRVRARGMDLGVSMPRLVLVPKDDAKTGTAGNNDLLN